MTWKPESDLIYETLSLDQSVSLNQTINTAMTSYHSGITNKFKQSQGTAYGDFGLPEAAPLVFPTLDLVGASDHEEAKKFKEKMARKKNYVADYYDRRATAEFVSLSLHHVRALDRASFANGCLCVASQKSEQSSFAECGLQTQFHVALC
jgi:hypothetical protein